MEEPIRYSIVILGRTVLWLGNHTPNSGCVLCGVYLIVIKGVC